QVRFRHGRALDVPAGPTAAPGAVPAGQVRGGRLPQHEVARVALVWGNLDARAGQHLLGGAARQLPVAGEGGDVEQNVAFGLVRMATVDQPLAHRDDPVDVPGGIGDDIGGVGAQPRHVLVVGLGIPAGDPVDGDAQLRRGRIDLVVHVGDVARIHHLRVQAPQQPHEQAEDHRWAGIADVHVVVDGRTADVDGDALRIERLETLEPAGEAVVER